MAPKKDLVALKVKEATMAAWVTGKRKRPAAIPAKRQELHRLKRGSCQDPVTMAVRVAEVVSTRAPARDIPAWIPLLRVLSGGLLSKGSSSSAEPIRDRLREALLPRDI